MDQFISYAQNFEDVMLWRALKHINQGFYVDVGANDPILDSITQAFYERGWRGINIEPMQSYFNALCRERTEDINVPFAAGASEGEANFFEIPATGLSSLVSPFGQNRQLYESKVFEHNIKTTTLNRIFEKYVSGPIHFVKIDVERSERAVLEGLDLSRWRPWIIVIEATRQNSPEPSYAEWEHLLLTSGYEFVYFDGLNRFYIPNEHSELIPAFSTPPNFFDHFISYQQFHAINEIERKNLALKEQQESLLILQKDSDNKNSALQKQQESLLALQNELDSKNSTLQKQQESLLALQNELDSKNSTLQKQQESLLAFQKELDNKNTALQKQQESLLAHQNELDSKNSTLQKQQASLLTLQKELDNKQQDLEVEKKEINALRSELVWERKDLVYLRTEIGRTRDEREALRLQNESVQAELISRRFEADNFRREYINLYASRSYRITAPLRWASGLLSGLKDRSRHPIKASVAEASVSALPVKDQIVEPTISEDELHFLNLFQREIAKRRN